MLTRVAAWLDHRLGFSRAILPIIEHRVPRSVNWWYVFGSATLVAFTVQVITGVALAFSYVAAPDNAYESLQFITDQAVLGNVVRGVHYWGASAMVVLIFVHLCRTFLMGSYKFPREVNWLTGVLLFGLTLGMAFTGQLLRWDQNAYWAVVVGAEQAGRVPWLGDTLAQVLTAGQTVGGATLTRFYATHVFVFPALIIGLVAVHLYLVVQHGISEPPGRGRVVDPATYEQEYEELIRKEGIPFWPDAAWKDVVFALAVGSIVLVLAVIVGPAALGTKADPTIIQADPRPDWYFLWYFALLALLPADVENLFMVGFPLLVVVVLLALPLLAPAGERSPLRRLGNVAPWSPDFHPAQLGAGVTQGLTPNQLRGAELFQQKGCINCHQMAGTGGQRGPDLTLIGDQLTADQLTWRIASGGHNMPAYGGTLKPEELAVLVEFLSQRKAPSP
jgi:ubiquinol-cytochrome c reductase cytochrome b subunit